MYTYTQLAPGTALSFYAKHVDLEGISPFVFSGLKLNPGLHKLLAYQRKLKFIQFKRLNNKVDKTRN